MTRIAVVLVLVLAADLKVGTTMGVASVVVPTSRAAVPVVVPTSRAAVPVVVPTSRAAAVVVPTSRAAVPVVVPTSRAAVPVVVPTSRAAAVVVPTSRAAVPVVVLTSRAAASVVVPTFRSALQQKPGTAEGRNPRLFRPQDLGLLEPPDREAWQKPDQVMDALHVAEGTTVVDIGAGGGWFTMRLARRVRPNGKVYAVDVQRLMIEAISRRIEREGLTDIVEPILGMFDDPKLPPEARPDAVLIVDAFPEMEDPVLMLKNIARTLKPQGRIGIINYREGDGGPGPDSAERVPPSLVISQAAAAGLKLVEQHKFLPYQYFLIFGK